MEKFTTLYSQCRSTFHQLVAPCKDPSHFDYFITHLFFSYFQSLCSLILLPLKSYKPINLYSNTRGIKLFSSFNLKCFQINCNLRSQKRDKHELFNFYQPDYKHTQKKTHTKRETIFLSYLAFDSLSTKH